MKDLCYLCLCRTRCWLVGESRARTGREWPALAVLLALTGWALLPSLRGEFVTDDYVFLATSRMVNAPWQAFWQRHFYEPLYFRPVGLVVWWLTERSFGLSYAWHAAFNATLHLANVALLWMVLRRFTSGVAARAVGVGWFALGPLSFPAVLWLSDRFDLLAVFFLLVMLLTALSTGRTARAAVVFLAALAACWSKEWAFAACLAVMLGFAWAGWRTRSSRCIAITGALFAAIALAWLVRISVLDGTATSLMADALSVGGVGVGALAWATAGGRIAKALGAGGSAVIFAGVCACSLVLVIAPKAGIRRRGFILIALTMVLFVAMALPQTVTVSGYIGLIDSGIFGAATTARFFYGPMLALSAVAAFALSSAGRNSPIRWFAISVSGACVLAFAIQANLAATEFSAWTNREIAPFSIAATATTDAIAKEGGEPCVVVFLGTQTQHPYFRMFSDVTVKARTATPDKTWACHVMTESTPWLFAFPSHVQPTTLPLREVPYVGNQAKPDSSWSSVRYRYRLPASDLAALPNAHFFQWQTDRFVDITEGVRRGHRTVKSQDW